MTDLTPTQRRTLVRIVNAAGVWRHFVPLDELHCKGPTVAFLLRRGLIERKRFRWHNEYRPTVTGCEVARGRLAPPPLRQGELDATGACNGA